MHRYLILSASIGLAACAAPAPEPEVASASMKNCHKEYRVGSHIPVVDCSEALSEADRQRVLDELRHSFRPVAAPAGSGG